MSKKILLILSIVAIIATSCEPPVVGHTANKGVDIKENMINANRTIAQSEETAIEQYVARRNWPMTKLSNGARFWEYEPSNGSKIDFEDSVTIHYSIEAINGKKIYTDMEETYIAGRRQSMTGLDDVVMQLHHGSKAKAILPSYLGYGIGGDGDRITQSMILVIDLSVEN